MEDKLIRLTGTRIVPAFIFKQKRLLMPAKTKVLIGFEQNKDEIRKLLLAK